jgi:ABC-type Fe3+ transport system substrate-binding protein
MTGDVGALTTEVTENTETIFFCVLRVLRGKKLVAAACVVAAALWLWGRTAAIAAQAGTLAAIVEGARKEGTVSLKLHPGLAGKGIERLKRGVAERYGVALQIAYVPSASYPLALAKAMFEYKAGAPPSFDLLPFDDANLAQAVSAGIVEKVDWKPLLAPGTPAEVVHANGYAISTHTNHIGLVYNPGVVSAQDVPKTLKDLVHPKWRGKIIVFPYTNLYLGYSVVLGVDQTLAVLRDMMKNEPTVEIYARGVTRYMAGEYPLLLTSSGSFTQIKRKGVAAQWSSLDVSFSTTHFAVVLKGAKHPNAAKLVALYLASPEGHKLMVEEAGEGSLFYPGDVEQEIAQEDRRRGLKMYNPTSWPGAMDLLLSQKGAQVEQEIGRILRSR